MIPPSAFLRAAGTNSFYPVTVETVSSVRRLSSLRTTLMGYFRSSASGGCPRRGTQTLQRLCTKDRSIRAGERASSMSMIPTATRYGSHRAFKKATKWQNHIIQGFVSGQVTKRMGLKVESTKNEGQWTYRIVN